MLRIAAALALTAALAPADVRVVAPSGAPYTEIQDAVDAAQDGDVILVRTGAYSSFSTRNLSVAIVADTNATVNVIGAIRVSGLGATRTLVLSGLNATGTHSPNSSGRHGLVVRNCAGAVRVCECQLTGVPLDVAGPNRCSEGQGALVESSGDVLFVHSTLQGSDAPGMPGYPANPGGSNIVPNANESDGGHGIFADVSAVTLYDCTLRGGRAGYTNFTGYGMCEPPPYASNAGYIAASGEGYRGRATFVFAASTSFTGANGWNTGCLGPCWCSCANAGGNGFVHSSGSALTGYLLACSASGGTGGSNNLACGCLTTGPCGPSCGCGPNPCSAPAGASIVGAPTQLAGTSRRLTATRVARELGVLTTTFEGPPGDDVQLFVSDRTARRVLTSASGVLHVRVHAPEPVLLAGTIPASGILTLTWTLPDLGPNVQSRVLFQQAAFVSATGATTLSSPAVSVLLDAAF